MITVDIAVSESRIETCMQYGTKELLDRLELKFLPSLHVGGQAATNHINLRGTPAQTPRLRSPQQPRPPPGTQATTTRRLAKRNQFRNVVSPNQGSLSEESKVEVLAGSMRRSLRKAKVKSEHTETGITHADFKITEII
eukprot:6180001-Pleurochrysis_carterae.AAC.2